MDRATRWKPPISGAMVSNISRATPRMLPGSCSSSSRRSAALIMPMALVPLGGGIDEWPGVAGTFSTTDR